jgi:hypothetical protein
MKKGIRGLTSLVPFAPREAENSNFVLAKIPIEIHRLAHGQRLIYMDRERLPEELGLADR